MYVIYLSINILRWCRGSELDCGLGDPGKMISGIPSQRVGPLMAKRLKTSSCPDAHVKVGSAR